MRKIGYYLPLQAEKVLWGHLAKVDVVSSNLIARSLCKIKVFDHSKAFFCAFLKTCRCPYSAV